MKKALIVAFVLLSVLGAGAQSADKGSAGTSTTTVAPAATGSATETAAVLPGAEPAAGEAGSAGVIPLRLSPIWVEATPAVIIPLGDSSNFFNVGGGGTIAGEYRLPFMPQLLARGELEYAYSPIPARQSVSFTSAGLGMGYSYNLLPNLGVEAYATGGATYGFFNTGLQGYWNPYVKAGVNAYFSFSPSLIVTLGGAFLYQVGLYTGVGISAGASIGLGAPVVVQQFRPTPRGLPSRPTPLLQKPGTGLELSKVNVSDIYPVFYKFYDDHPIGTAVLHNWEKSPVQNVKVTVFVKEYMDNPKEVKGPDKMDPGAETTIDLYGLFNKGVLNNTESTKVSAAVSVQYLLRGNPVSTETVQTIQVLRRNSLTWDDDRKAAAFVSANDPTAVRFAKNVQSMVQSRSSSAIDQSIQLAAAIHEALTLYGLTYSNDPVATLNSDNKTVDYIQFPQQTLDYKGGKCSDFSVLYSSMLEAIGVETAFITVPGHIYMAVALGMTQDAARKTFQNSDDFIYESNKVWLPIEITLRDGGFLKAWQLGAKEWRENKAKDQARFYPVHAAWSIYQPVGYSSNASNIQIPAPDKVVKQFSSAMSSFVSLEIGQQENVLLAAANRASNKSRPLNSLAVLYSRFGQYDKAQKTLKDLLAREEYVPALINMGNIFFVQNQVDKALDYYNRAYKKEPNNATVLLCVARANHSLENYSIAKKAYAQLQTVDPDLAQRFAYLDLRGEEATRAADAGGQQKTVIWQE